MSGEMLACSQANNLPVRPNPVAISSAIAIQDAVDNLRSINTICTTAIGAALAQAIEHPSSMEELQKIITTIQDVAKDAITNFEKINNSATASVNKKDRAIRNENNS